MYDLMEVETYRPKGDYKIDADAFYDGSRDELIAALDAVETVERRQNMARWHSVIRAFARLFAPPQQDGRTAVSS